MKVICVSKILQIIIAVSQMVTNQNTIFYLNNLLLYVYLLLLFPGMLRWQRWPNNPANLGKVFRRERI